jgi:hypothetical protein
MGGATTGQVYGRGVHLNFKLRGSVLSNEGSVSGLGSEGRMAVDTHRGQAQHDPPC